MVGQGCMMKYCITPVQDTVLHAYQRPFPPLSQLNMNKIFIHGAWCWFIEVQAVILYYCAFVLLSTGCMHCS